MRAEPKTGFNLSKWALDHPALTRYLMLVLMLLGVFAFFNLGQDEDPPFTFRVMVVRAYWPGASAQQVAEQVTDKLERTLQEVPYAYKIRSYSKPGEAQIIFQVVEYGMMSDWLLVQKIYPKEELKEVVLNLRTLDKVTLSYLSHFFQIDKTQFRCYTSSQSARSFWNS